jgi:hypothetical protein
MNWCESGIVEDEDEDGEYVRYKDAMARIAELEAKLDEERQRRGSLQFNHDYLQRGCADDALTIHTMGETNDGLRKDLDYYRTQHRKLVLALEEIAGHDPDCDCKTYQYCPCLSCTAKKALGRGMWAET